MTSQRHIAIIGSGSGAFAAALRAAEAGAQVSLIESGTLGGTCVNVGCVPSKILLRAGEIAHRREAHPFDGLPRKGGPIHHSALMRQLRGRVDELRQTKYHDTLASEPGINRLVGRARLTNAHQLVIENAGESPQHLDADRILIATGSSPKVPPIPGLADTPYWTSTEALFAEQPPTHLVVIGSSFVALEIAQAWRRLGSRVTILARGALLSRMVPEVGQSLQEALAAEGIDIRTHTRIEEIDHDGTNFSLTTDNDCIQADRLLVATGRRPNTDRIGLEAAGVATNEQGAIRVDDHLRTTVEHIHAVGDCADMPQLVYVAAAAGTRAAINMTGGDARLDLSVVPAVIFTDPQVATVGLDEHQARAGGLETMTRSLPLSEVPRAQANFETHGLIRLVADANTDRLLGVQAVAPRAGELIQTAALAIRQQLTVDELAGELFPYLTMVEGLKLCAQTFRRDISRLSCCAG